jgi:predicted metal-dependent HD superfamily phosphohydrolase
MRDNDNKSALFAKNYLEQIGVPNKVVEYVVALIQATAGHRVIEDNPDSAIFMDGDLAILGSSEEIYDQYAAKIRKEYECVTEDQYKEERIKVLKGFLKRPRIYITERANKELEQQARKNIEREIATLENKK